MSLNLQPVWRSCHPGPVLFLNKWVSELCHGFRSLTLTSVVIFWLWVIFRHNSINFISIHITLKIHGKTKVWLSPWLTSRFIDLWGTLWVKREEHLWAIDTCPWREEERPRVRTNWKDWGTSFFHIGKEWLPWDSLGFRVGNSSSCPWSLDHFVHKRFAQIPLLEQRNYCIQTYLSFI